MRDGWTRGEMKSYDIRKVITEHLSGLCWGWEGEAGSVYSGCSGGTSIIMLLWK